MNLALLISQVVLFFLSPRFFSRHFFFWSFLFWRAAYNAGLGWVLTKQSKRKWIVREVSQRGWLDDSKRPKVREWVREQLSVKMGRDYDFDVSPLSLSVVSCAPHRRCGWAVDPLPPGGTREAFCEVGVDPSDPLRASKHTQVHQTPFGAVERVPAFRPKHRSRCIRHARRI